MHISSLGSSLFLSFIVAHIWSNGRATALAFPPTEHNECESTFGSHYIFSSLTSTPTNIIPSVATVRRALQNRGFTDKLGKAVSKCVGSSCFGGKQRESASTHSVHSASAPSQAVSQAALHPQHSPAHSSSSQTASHSSHDSDYLSSPHSHSPHHHLGSSTSAEASFSSHQSSPTTSNTGSGHGGRLFDTVRPWTPSGSSSGHGSHHSHGGQGEHDVDNHHHAVATPAASGPSSPAKAHGESRGKSIATVDYVGKGKSVATVTSPPTPPHSSSSSTGSPKRRPSSAAGPASESIGYGYW